MFFAIAVHDQFISVENKRNWINVWRDETMVNYDWASSPEAYDYAVILFKGFSVLTNLGYESGIPELSDELVASIISQNVKVHALHLLLACSNARQLSLFRSCWMC